MKHLIAITHVVCLIVLTVGTTLAFVKGDVRMAVAAMIFGSYFAGRLAGWAWSAQ
jgi:hypothetical protein